MSNGTITKIGNTAAGLGTVVTQPTLDLLTAMGHGNGSGATEEFVTMPGMANTINAANYDGATNAAKVNAAIADAVTKGKTYCFVPKSLLPYTASAVTFDTGVHMICEGGPTYTGWYDVRAYGATLNHVTDDTAAVNAALSAAVASPNASGAKTLWFDGLAGIKSPIRVTGPGVTFLARDQGWNTERTVGPPGAGIAGLYGLSGWQGPLTIVESGDRTFPGITTSLVTGSGNAFDMSVQNSHKISLWPIANSDLNGLSAFTVRFWYKKNGAPLHAPIVTVSGKLLTSDSGTWPLVIWLTLGGQLQLSLVTTGGTGSIIGGPVIADADVNYVEGNYDGSTLRLFLNGSLIASAALTGTISCQPYNTLTIGPDVWRAPDQDRLNNGGGIVDSVEFSNVARNTVDYTPPTSKHSADSHTLALFNFDNQVGYWTVGDSKDGDVWAYHTLATAGTAADGFTAKGFHWGSATGKHVALFLGVASSMPTLYRCSFGYVRAGVFGPQGNHFQWQFDRLFFIGNEGMIYGLALGQNSSIGQLSNVWLYNSRIPFLLSAAGNAEVRNLHWACSTGGKHIAAVVTTHNEVTGSPLVVTNVNVDSESGLDTTYRAGFLVGAFSGTVGSGIIAKGCNVLNRNAAPFVIVDGRLDAGVFQGCNFQVLGGADPAAVMQVLGAVTVLVRPVIFDHCGNHGAAFIPWSATAGMARVGALGKGSAVTYSATPTFDCSVRDEFELTLTGDCAPTITKVTPGQSILVTIIQDGAGAHAFTWPANVKGGGVISATGGSVNQQRFTAMLDSATNPTLMADAALVSA